MKVCSFLNAYEYQTVDVSTVRQCVMQLGSSDNDVNYKLHLSNHKMKEFKFGHF